MHHHLTSIPPHSKTRNKLRSDARTESAQNDIRSERCPVIRSRSRRRLLPSPMSPGVTPWKDMKARVTTSCAGDPHRRRLLVGRLREEMQCNVFVLEQIWQPIPTIEEVE